MSKKIYISGSKFYIEDTVSGELKSDSAHKTEVRRSSTTATEFNIYSKDLGHNAIEVTDIVNYWGGAFASAAAFEYWADVHTGEGNDLDPAIMQAMNEVLRWEGDVISVEHKAKCLLKFGRTEEVQTSKTTIMAHKTGTFNETYVSTNIIDTVSSSDGSDAVDVTIEGHTIDGEGDFTFVTQTATLDGQNKVVLGTPLARMTRIFNDSGTELAGAVYGYQDSAITSGVPDNGALVHCVIPLGLQQSEKCATTISSVDYWLLTRLQGDVLEKTSTFGDFHLEERQKGGVFRDVQDFSASSTSDGNVVFAPYHIVNKNSDVRIRASAGSNNKEFAATIQGLLATVIE